MATDVASFDLRVVEVDPFEIARLVPSTRQLDLGEVPDEVAARAPEGDHVPLSEVDLHVLPAFDLGRHVAILEGRLAGAPGNNKSMVTWVGFECRGKCAYSSLGVSSSHPSSSTQNSETDRAICPRMTIRVDNLNLPLPDIGKAVRVSSVSALLETCEEFPSRKHSVRLRFIPPNYGRFKRPLFSKQAESRLRSIEEPMGHTFQ